MSVIRPPTQVHDGFATIRTRGLCRTKSRAEQIERCRTASLNTNFNTIDDQNHNNNEINFLQKQNDKNTEEPYYSSPKSLPCSTFRPTLNAITPPTILPNIITNPLLSSEYQNVVKKSQFSLESLSSSTATPRTPNDEYQDPKDDDIFLYSAPESPQYCNVGQGLVTFDELELQNLSNTKPIVRKPPIRSGLPYKRTSFSADCKSNDGSGSNGDLNSISSGGSSAYNNQIYSNSYNEPRKSKEIYINNNIINNYYRPSCTALVTTNRNRSSSAEILDIDDTQCQNQSKLSDHTKKLGIVGRQNAITTIYNDNNIDGGFVRRYHTLGHTRSSNGLAEQNHKAMTMKMMTSNNSMRHLSNRTNNNNNNKGDGVKSWHNDQREFNITDYVDPLDFKVGCQTTLRSKPIIPWYELAIRKDLKRKSCPAITNQTHVVAAFEESLTNMTTQLHELKANNVEHKVDDLSDMCQTVELLRKQSIQAGLTTQNTNFQQLPNNLDKNHLLTGDNSALGNRQLKKNSSIVNRTVNCNLNTGAKNLSVNSNSSGIYNHISSVNIPSFHRHSIDSICSINSISSGNFAQEKQNVIKKTTTNNNSWLRSSFRRAFSRNEKNINLKQEQQQQRHSSGSTISNADQNLIMTTTFINRRKPGLNDIVKNSSFPPPPLPIKSNSRKSISLDNDHENNVIIQDLKKQLREKDLVLTDIRLEALNSASQLESLKDIVIKMRSEILNLRQSNEKLQKLVDNRSLDESETSLENSIVSNESTIETQRPQISLPINYEEENNIFEDQKYSPVSTELMLKDPLSAITARLSPTYINSSNNDILESNLDGKKIAITVFLGHPEEFSKYVEKMYSNESKMGHKIEVEIHEVGKNLKDYETDLNENYELTIGYTYISGKISWDSLDFIVRKTFKEYVSRIDPGSNLGLNTDFIKLYHLGEAKRCAEIILPELLPCGYLIGNVKNLYICLQGVGSLAFDNLIPRSIVNRYVNLLTEHRRLILCGPSGTGKSHLSQKLAEFVVAQSDSTSKDIITIDVGRKSLEELRQFIGNISQKLSRWNEGACEQPAVIILDDLHKASGLGDLFSYILNAGPASKLPFIIGTMLQSNCTAANAQLHHNFRWVITANHVEPVKGFLGRFLRRRAFTLELLTQNYQPELLNVLSWLSNVWQHINQFLENYTSSDVTIGPGIFLSCALNLKDSQIWFTDLWNYNLAPYIINSISNDIKIYGKRSTVWNDPSKFIRDTYPWPYGPDSVPPLKQISGKDVGLDDNDIETVEKPDPLLNMLICLQEAANYSDNNEKEIDSASAISTSSSENSTES